MITPSNITLLLAALATALMAGLFYSYSCSVNPGLGKLQDAEYLTAMKSINKAIQNPAFFCAFFGALILLPVSAFLNYAPDSVRFWLVASAAVVYAGGLFGVTVFGNVPLNNALEGFSIANASAEEIATIRRSFENPWNSYHSIRTVAVIASLILVLMACLVKDNSSVTQAV